jgi:hypothetical protein
MLSLEDNNFPFDLSDGKNIDGLYWDDDKTILKYKLEPVGKHVYIQRWKNILELTNTNIKPKNLKFYSRCRRK